MDLIDKDMFLRIANKYDGNRYVKHFTCWNHLAVLMLGQLSNRESLRDVVLATQAHCEKAYHLGFERAATKSNLPDTHLSDPNLVDWVVSEFKKTKDFCQWLNRTVRGE